MKNTGKLIGKTIFITGGSRGIGKAIGIKAAKDGANVVIASKTSKPHPVLEGTIYSAVREVEDAGGKGLACVVDVRDEKQVQAAVDETVKEFGGIDIVINNASALSFTGTEETDMKRYDLINSINTRGTFLVSKLCLPYLKQSSHAHILNISPPLSISSDFFGLHVAYGISKIGMTLCALGMSKEFRPYNIAVNALWPKTTIETAAITFTGGKEAANHCRKVDIMADAAYILLTQEPKPNGEFLLDEEVLIRSGVTNLDQYLVNPEFKDKLGYSYFEEGAAWNEPLHKQLSKLIADAKKATSKY